MVALYTVFYNWTKIHKTLRTTPAMAAGLTERVWDRAEIVGTTLDSLPLTRPSQRRYVTGSRCSSRCYWMPGYFGARRTGGSCAGRWPRENV